ncbi:MAG: ATP-binding protein [Chitinispirillaceae bacterium]|nr:ATP-binding protein [Chitinispirillaceae bacterium]
MQLSNYIPRNIVLPDKLSFFLFGPRQTGKSWLINRLFTDDCWKIDLLLSDVYLEYLKAPELFRREAEAKIAQGALSTIIVDEIQRLPGLLTEIHYLIEKYPRLRFVLIGSSARKLKRGGADMLAGRAVSCHLFPLTHEELGDGFDLETVLRYGGLPSLTGKNDGDRQRMLSAYVETYLREEIKAEGIARNLSGFSRFLDIAASQCGDLVNGAAIARECRLAQKTVEGYFEILEDTLVGFRLESWRKSPRKRLSTHPKFYLFDTGVVNAVNRRLSAKLEPRTRGRLFELFMINEVRSAIHYTGSEARMFFWRTSNSAEVDLIIEKHGTIVAAVEFKSHPRVCGADCSGLRSFRSDNPGTPLYVACTAMHRYDLNGVTVLPWQELLGMLRQWL